jgi:hypothetical protein
MSENQNYLQTLLKSKDLNLAIDRLTCLINCSEGSKFKRKCETSVEKLQGARTPKKGGSNRSGSIKGYSKVWF